MKDIELAYTGFRVVWRSFPFFKGSAILTIKVEIFRKMRQGIYSL
ncbi:hypothetical protein J2S78_000300 [Salibacterium salarium]|nr:hypothetical protein [Salibacterium salarium]MDQ0297892.1 hypothetical protein [Salibacterium salarium]